MRGLERYEGAPAEEIRGATRAALRNLVKLAIDEQAASVLVAGDLYDSDWKDCNTGLFFANEIRRLREAGIRVLLIGRNHDAASQITRSLRMPENVRVFSSERPETVVLEEPGEPVPFVLDDVLVHFDNERSRMTLLLLADLSRRIQVLSFTHHTHLIERATATVPRDVLFVHTLEP